MVFSSPFQPLNLALLIEGSFSTTHSRLYRTQRVHLAALVHLHSSPRWSQLVHTFSIGPRSGSGLALRFPLFVCCSAPRLPGSVAALFASCPLPGTLCPRPCVAFRFSSLTRCVRFLIASLSRSSLACLSAASLPPLGTPPLFANTGPSSAFFSASCLLFSAFCSPSLR